MINYQETLKYYSEWFDCDNQEITKDFCNYYQENCRFYIDEYKNRLLQPGYGKIFSKGLICYEEVDLKNSHINKDAVSKFTRI